MVEMNATLPSRGANRYLAFLVATRQVKMTQLSTSKNIIEV
jgi:hypothetical protein